MLDRPIEPVSFKVTGELIKVYHAYDDSINRRCGNRPMFTPFSVGGARQIRIWPHFDKRVVSAGDDLDCEGK